jgi:hypothetical protein
MEQCALARYYFHFRDTEGVVRDEEGVDMPHLEAVETEALAALSQMSGDGISDGIRHVEVQVTNMDGVTVLTAELTLKLTRLLS